MKVGYVRVSPVEQNEARQLEQMKKYEVDKIYMEKISGEKMEVGKEILAMLEFVKEGDTI